MGCGASSKPPPDGGAANAAEETKAAPGPAEKPLDKDTEKKVTKEENAHYAQVMQFLGQVPLFKCLPKDEHPLLAANTETVNFKEGETIIKQGTTGTEFFIIHSGEATVLVDSGGGPTKVASLRTGDYFGEGALLRDEPRTATILAATAMSTLKVTREKFKQLGLNEKLQFATRKAVGMGGRGGNLKVKPPTEKSPEDRQLIAEALRNNENLQTMVSLDETRIDAIIDVAWKEEVAEGVEVIQEGDLSADYFYIVESGTVEIVVAETAPENKSAESALGNNGGSPQVVSNLGKGGSFGELALLYLVPRAATVKCTAAAVLWVIDRQNFKSILMKVSAGKINEYVGYLNNVSLLNMLLAEEKKAVATAMVEMHFTQGENVLQQGENGKTFYVLYQGEVSVTKDGVEVNKLTASKKDNLAQYFGEQALLSNEPRAATVSVSSSTAKVLALERDAFDLLLGPLQDIMKLRQEDTSGTKRTSFVKTLQAGGPLKQPAEKVLRKDLKRLGLLGCGGFGVVELYEHKPSGNTYAMKGLSKGYIVKTGMQESTVNEKNILSMTNSPFIIKLYATYNGSQSLYFLLEAALGGELYATYNRKGFHGSEKHAKFYIAGTVLAFEHLHERRIIYRDLKPENILLNEKGQYKLTDMGLAKFVIGKTYTTCGTPDYFAPEIIASTGHSSMVDWWGLGILLFELMTGHPPFESPYPMQIYSKVMKGISRVPFPPKCQGPLEHLIKSLLKKEPSERLPCRPGGVDNLRKHEWYSGFDWDAYYRLEIPPPFLPVVKSKQDLANFSARKEDLPKQIEYVDDGSGWDKNFATD
mmetsp:Transcript_23229/g.53454  ORF Transcript_23229/g.53454 Transcript_23229/m.53454 type:complete len:815 (+) Transcript_23229:67-2511(+)